MRSLFHLPQISQILFIYCVFEDGRENFLFHMSSIKFTFGLIGNTFGVIFNTPGVFFKKARFSANKAALLKIKPALLTNKLTFSDFG